METKAVMTRHIQNTFTDIGNSEMRKTVYDYTCPLEANTFPDRDLDIFSRENMLHPFCNIKDKVDSIMNYLKLSWYWEDEEEGNFRTLDKVMHDSLFGQAIRLLVASNYYCFCNDVDLALNINLQELPIVFGDLMIIYAQSGYDVRNLKDFLVELYDEYYSKVAPQEKDQIKGEHYLHISDDEFSSDISEFFRLIYNINSNFMNDYIICRILHRSPDQNNLKDIVNNSRDMWINGFRPNPEDFVEYHDQHSNSIIRYLPILNAAFIIKLPSQKNKEFEDILHQQIEAMVLKAFKGMELNLHGGDFHNDTINNEAWRRIIANKTDNLLTEVMINHSENISTGGETINGSLVMIRLSIIDH